ncbi:hypothetical protein V6N11_055832 [Hibiscus sabdariffa]|uniref:Uncharacterized protein n=1 Tax=Hibiscus sabdariffa TaxID=183260 RepID=A0ABR2T2P6_9ROSI
MEARLEEPDNEIKGEKEGNPSKKNTTWAELFFNNAMTQKVVGGNSVRLGPSYKEEVAFENKQLGLHLKSGFDLSEVELGLRKTSHLESGPNEPLENITDDSKQNLGDL